MTKITLVCPDQLDFGTELLGFLDQETINDILDQINRLLDERLDRFRTDFQKRFQGCSPELFSDLLHIQNIKIPPPNK